MQINGKNVCDFCFEPLGNDGICKKCGLSQDTYKTNKHALHPGTTIAGNYVIGAVLSQDGNCFNYLAYSYSYEKKVVIKEYFPESFAMRSVNDNSVIPKLESDKEKLEKSVELFADEAKKIAGFNASKNIRIVYELFYENNTVYYSTEALDGMFLGTFVKSNGGYLSEYEALTVTKHLCNALMVVHSGGMVSNEICPENVFITNSGEVKLTEFGMTRHIADSKMDLMPVLHASYAPIELYSGDKNIGFFSDIYSLGALMYFCAFGKNIGDAVSRVDTEVVNADTSVNSVSEDFIRIMNKCLKLNASERYQNVFELSNEITPLIEKFIEKGALPVVGDGDTKKIVIEVAIASSAIGAIAGAAAVAGKAVSDGGAGTLAVHEPLGIGSGSGNLVNEPSGISLSSGKSPFADSASEIVEASSQKVAEAPAVGSDGIKETSTSHTPTSKDYTKKSNARNGRSSSKSEDIQKAENKPSTSGSSAYNNAADISFDNEVIDVGDKVRVAEPPVINNEVSAVPPVRTGGFPKWILIVIISLVGIIGAGAVMYFTGALDFMFNNEPTSTGRSFCHYCGTLEHTSIEHPPCSFCGTMKHFTENHPRCEYCGMQEHYTQDHPPCEYCGSNEHFTEGHPPCKYCGTNEHLTAEHPACAHCGSYRHYTSGHPACEYCASNKHLTKDHEPCGICGSYYHFTNKHPCDYCTAGGHASENCPNKPCAYCGSTDHKSGEHPYYCSQCGYSDHNTANCPYNEKCGYCGQNHRYEVCPYNQPSPDYVDPHPGGYSHDYGHAHYYVDPPLFLK